MPLARIITDNSQYSEELAKDLRSRGFEILNSTSSDSPESVADLEITLRDCDADQASNFATGLPNSKDMRVFVTPKALAGNVRSIEMFVVKPKTQAVEAPSAERIVFESITPIEEVESKAAPEQSVAAIDPEPTIAAESTLTPSVRESATDSEISASNPEPLESDVVPHGLVYQAVTKSEPRAEEPATPSATRVFSAIGPIHKDPVSAPTLATVCPTAMHAAVDKRKGDQRFWNAAALAGAAAVVALAAMLLAHRFSPLPAKASMPVPATVQQAVPFAPMKPETSETPTTQQPPKAVASVQPPSLSATPKPKPSIPAERVVQASRKQRESRPKVRRRIRESDFVAEDTVKQVQ